MTVEVRIPTYTRGERMAKARSDAKFTQKDMADLFGQSPATIAKWEARSTQPRDLMNTLKRWAELTHVPMEWLLFGEESTKRENSTRRNRTGPGRGAREHPNQVLVAS